MCLSLFTFLFSIYPTLAGKFWNYHYMPFAYFSTISAGLCLFNWPEFPKEGLNYKIKEALPVLVLLVAVTMQLNLPGSAMYVVNDLRSGSEAHDPKRERVDEISGWLKNRLHSGDSVQPLDWTGGSIHAMLLAEARLSTRFLYDYHFYHHISSPYIKQLKKSFISHLRHTSPRFIIAVKEGKPWVSGIGTTRKFPELQQVLAEDYTLAIFRDG